MKTLSLTARDVPLDDSYEVIVAGGGPAGCAAALAAAREGARTLLLEANGALGGMGTLGLVPFFCGYADGEKFLARGVAEQVRLRLVEGTPHLRKPQPDWMQFWPAIDPELLKRIYDDLVLAAGAEVLFHTHLTAVECAADGSVDALIVASKSSLSAFRAKIYVDCTGDGDLAVWAGAEFAQGDAAGALQPATHCFMLTNVDEYALQFGPALGWTNPTAPVHKMVASDRYPLIVDLHCCDRRVGPGTCDFNMGHVYGVDATDPASVTLALFHGRRQAAQYRDAFAEFHPAFANAFLAQTGALLGVRETRRLVGDYELTAADYRARASFADEICRNAYNIDLHATDVKSETGKSVETLKNEMEAAIEQYQPGESYGVPYRCLTPRGLRNVLVAGRCISTDRAVNGSIRIMPCCLTTGEAAGLAAALAASGSGDVHAVDTADLRARLRGHGAYLP